jgi:hypothetical protein
MVLTRRRESAKKSNTINPTPSPPAWVRIHPVHPCSLSLPSRPSAAHQINPNGIADHSPGLPRHEATRGHPAIAPEPRKGFQSKPHHTPTPTHGGTPSHPHAPRPPHRPAFARGFGGQARPPLPRHYAQYIM